MLADTSSDDDRPLAAAIADQKGKQPAAPELPESEDDDQPGTSAQHAARAQARRSARLHDAARPPMLEDSSEEDKEKEEPLQRAGKKRRRRQAAAEAGNAVRKAGPDAELVDEDDMEEEVVELPERSAEKKRLRKASGAVVMAGGQVAAGRGAVRTRTRTLPTRPSVLERLQQHQVTNLVRLQSS